MQFTKSNHQPRIKIIMWIFDDIGKAIKGFFDGMTKAWDGVFHHLDKSKVEADKALQQGKDALTDAIKAEWESTFKPMITQMLEKDKQEILANLKEMIDQLKKEISK